MTRKEAELTQIPERYPVARGGETPSVPGRAGPRGEQPVRQDAQLSPSLGDSCARR